jgi:hypothetical protein
MMEPTQDQKEIVQNSLSESFKGKITLKKPYICNTKGCGNQATRLTKDKMFGQIWLLCDECREKIDHLGHNLVAFVPLPEPESVKQIKKRRFRA